MTNPFAHIELSTDDAVTARKFYAKLFPSWKVTDMPMPSGVYSLIDPGLRGPGRKAAAAGGIQKKPFVGMPTGWTPYIQVDDVTRALARAEKLGATRTAGPEDIGMGIIAVFTDPSGAPCGLWTPNAPKAKKRTKKPAKAAKRRRK